MTRFKPVVIIFILLAVLVVPVFLFKNRHLMARLSTASDYNYLKIYNSQNFNPEHSGQIPLFADSRGYSLAIVDLGGDGQDEILLGAGPGDKPWVKILRGDGSLVNEFLAYAEDFTGGVEVAGCDLDGDARDEILTGVRSHGGPHIRIFDGFGNLKFTPGFFADDKNSGNGVQVGCADIEGNGQEKIIAVTGGDESKKLKIFDKQGNLITQNRLTHDFSHGLGQPKISNIDLGGDGVDEILVSAGRGDKPVVQIYRGDLSLINQFLVYAENFTGGINVFGADVDNDNQGEIIVAPGIAGGPHLRIFDGFGREKITNRTFLGDQNFRGGLVLAVGDVDGDNDLEIITASQNLPIGRTDLDKYIDIDISEQRFRYYEQGILLGDFSTSTGKPSTPTRLGEFEVISKHPMAYGGADGMRWAMPWFLGFYTSGGMQNGIHELPFLNGYREGERSLGHAVSHGCVRLAIGPAKEVYDWAEVGVTKVFVHQ